jgi:hypothetical protein
VLVQAGVYDKFARMVADATNKLVRRLHRLCLHHHPFYHHHHHRLHRHHCLLHHRLHRQTVSIDVSIIILNMITIIVSFIIASITVASIDWC